MFFSFLKSTAQRPEESSLKTASSSSRFLRSGACGIASVRPVAHKDCEKTALVSQEEESVVCMSPSSVRSARGEDLKEMN